MGRRDGASVDRAVADHDRGAAPDRTPDRAGGAAPQRAPASGRAADDGSDGPPDETPAFAPAPLAASLDAAAVRRVWPEILAAARTQSRSVEAMLVNATVRAVQDDVLVLGMGVPSLARRLSEPRNADVVSAALHSVLGVRWQVRCEHGDAPPPAPRGGGGAAAPPPPAPSRRPAPVRRSTAPDDGEPLPPEPPDEDVPPPVDEETMIAEAAATPVASGERRDPEEEAIELLSSQLGAKAMKGP